MLFYWMSSQPELLPLPKGLPTAPYLYTIEQLLRHETDSMAHSLRMKSKQHADFMKQQDLCKFGKKQAFRSIREASPGLVQTLNIARTTPAALKNPHEYGLVTVTADQEVHWDVLKPIKINHRSTILNS